jgi:hypothetical protein
MNTNYDAPSSKAFRNGTHLFSEELILLSGEQFSWLKIICSDQDRIQTSYDITYMFGNTI